MTVSGTTEPHAAAGVQSGVVKRERKRDPNAWFSTLTHFAAVTASQMRKRSISKSLRINLQASANENEDNRTAAMGRDGRAPFAGAGPGRSGTVPAGAAVPLPRGRAEPPCQAVPSTPFAGAGAGTPVRVYAGAVRWAAALCPQS